jgi:hypothetical protein
VRGACPHDCPDTCALEVTVSDGRVVKVAGAADHPPTAGVLCTKVAFYPERIYHPDRLLHPLRRVGAKGPGARFERISWDAGAGDHRRALPQIIASRRRRSDRSLQLRRQLGPARLRVDGPPLLPPSRRRATRPDDLRQRRRDGLPGDDRRQRRLRRRERRRRAADHPLGQQQRRLQPALLAPGAGSQAARCAPDRHRPLPHGDRRQVRPAHRAAAGNRQRAGARPDARADPRRPARPRLHRPPHARLRRAQGARAGLPAGAGGGDLRHQHDAKSSSSRAPTAAPDRRRSAPTTASTAPPAAAWRCARWPACRR